MIPFGLVILLPGPWLPPARVKKLKKDAVREERVPKVAYARHLKAAVALASDALGPHPSWYSKVQD